MNKDIRFVGLDVHAETTSHGDSGDQSGPEAVVQHVLRADVGQAVELAPYLRDANYTLYLCLKKQGRTAEAEACQERMRQAMKAREELAALTKRLQETPGDADLRYQIAQLFLRFGDEQEGVRWLATNLQNHPQHAPSQQALAAYHEKQREAAKLRGGSPNRGSANRR